MCLVCSRGAHLDLCSNAVSLGSILYSLGLKDYSLTEQSGKHANNLVGLHSACGLWHTQRPTQYSILCMNQIYRSACASPSHALSQTHTHKMGVGVCMRVYKRCDSSTKLLLHSPIELQGTTLAGTDTERHPVLWIPVQLHRYTYRHGGTHKHHVTNTQNKED